MFSHLCVISGFLSDVNDICIPWDFAQRKTVVSHRRFCTTHQAHLRGSMSSGTVKTLKTDPKIVPKRR